ncbi:osmotically-inducible protein OsmY [Pasteurellaceae bacterium RH1A]|nr:osmotically-inducible protein OsmY [Pasteurellaceae bacterium RH1A]
MLKKMILVLSLVALQGCITTAVVTTAAVATKVATDPRSAGRQIDDETLEEKVSFNLGKDAELSQSGRINVVAYNGNVLLIGQVPSEGAKESARNIAAGVEGVNNVYNEIRIGQPIGFAQISKDSWITTQAKSKLLISSEVKTTDVKVITENGEVFLMGNVTRTAAEAASNNVRNISGVTRVITAFSYIQ